MRNYKNRFISSVFLVLIILSSAGVFFPIKNSSFEPISEWNDGLNLSDDELVINTPENKTYIEPMSGYYPATYGFENDEDGSFPMGWIDDSVGASSEVIVESEMAGHKKVVHYSDTGVTGTYAQSITNLKVPQTAGSVEYYLYKQSGTGGFQIDLRNSTGEYAIIIGVDYNNDGKFMCRLTPTYVFEFGVGKYADNTWFHLKIDFDLISKKFDIYLDGIKEVDQVNIIQEINIVHNIWYHQTGSQLWSNWYIDALSFSWDLDYNIGDNLYEGLLLSFENSTNFDWIGYSLDGQANKTILGNSTIQIPDDGLHTIQISGYSSLGTTYQSDIRHFSVDTGSPKITIITPSQDEFFGFTPPNFEISILKPNIAKIWYTLDSGITNVTSVGLTGTINQTEWEKKGDGPVTIGFYANDTLGFEGYTEVTVNKIAKINIHSPENKTYIEPMSGYYPATYGFENDEDGSFPMGWIDESAGVAYVNVASEMAGHKKVLQYYSHLTSYSTTTTNLSSPQTTGSIEYYVYKDGGGKGFQIELRNSTGGYALKIGIDYNYDGKFVWRTSGLIAAEFGVGKFSHDTWFHLRIDFDLVANKFDIYLDGVKEVDQEDFFYDINSLQNIGFYQTFYSYDGLWYLDALSFSWDLDYNIEDNLYEGLLLSFEDTYIFDWMGYSLDGQANKTILGNTTIQMPDDGLHTIQVFGDSSLGITYQSDIRYFSVDTSPPKITILTPSQDGFYGYNPPNFEISILKPNIAKIWYTLDGGIINVTSAGLTGTIDQAEWDKIVADIVTIKFYANDTSGFEGNAEVVIKKDLNPPQSSISREGLTFTITAEDGLGSGVSVLRYKINGSTWIYYTSPFNLDYGNYNITYQAIDAVGNVEVENTLIIKLSEPDISEEPPNWTIIIMTTAIIGGIGLVIVITMIIRKRK